MSIWDEIRICLLLVLTEILKKDLKFQHFGKSWVFWADIRPESKLYAKFPNSKFWQKNWIIMEYGNILFNIMLFCILLELVLICCYALFEYLNTLISNLIYDRLKWGISQIYWFAINFPNSKGLNPSPKVLIEKPTVNTIV